MTLVLDNTVGGMSANSYATVAEADAYHEARGFNSEWTQATTADKTQSLVWATRLLDEQEFVGIATFRTAPLRWPRYGVVNRENMVVDPQVIPQFLKEATAEWAFKMLKEDRTDDEGGLVEYGGKVGPIKTPDYYVRNVMPPTVREMLRPYLSGPRNGLGRVSRS